MHTRERRSALLAALKEKKKVTVAELASAFDVTTMTIRRDLKRLADENIVTLVHGGAIYNEGGTTLASVGVRALLNQQGKSQLGRYCASLVQEGNAIYLDSGSTCMSIAALAGRQNIAVLTNSLAVMNILAGSTGLQPFSMGGIFDHGTNGFFGDLACRTIRGFRIDLAFLGVSSLSLEGGVMSPTANDQALKKTLFETARQKIVVVDHTKIGHESFLRVADLREIDTLVTDKQADKDFLAGARRQGVAIVQI
ncbi:DeoR/GlpR family DNA-binding transcription regulator [uncultured Mitsuokella sp.]|uniref:DeoR/GlpR family DNA-binding transcription regulator n=1 Tax=uncultured Mitsuokella sp. TaxID=453120 RepID=UPI0025EA3D0C|nr:DeoR/GlpR family DNA-binding transcription regulator [uncultured Mitsuokella sp.]